MTARGEALTWTIEAASMLEARRADWDRLNQESAALPLLETDFILPLLEHFATGAEKLVCGARGGSLCVMLLLAPSGRGSWQTFQPAQAPLGACVHNAAAGWPDCLASLLPKLPRMVIALGVTQQDPALQPRPADHATLRTLDYIRTARITLGGSFDEYWNGRGKNLRQNLTKQRNRLEREGIVTRLQCSTAPDEVAAAIADYDRLETSGWKAASGTAVRSDDAQGQFYGAMLRNFCARGRCRIYRYWYGDRVAAMDLCIEGNGCLVILKTAYDEAIAGTTSPALLMRREALAELFQQPHLERIEFYGKLLEWHTRWTTEVRTMFHFTVYRWPLILRLRALLRPADGTASDGAPPPESARESLSTHSARSMYSSQTAQSPEALHSSSVLPASQPSTPPSR